MKTFAVNLRAFARAMKRSFIDVLIAIVPMFAIMTVLTLVFARGETDYATLFFGALMVLVGMALFLFGADLSMMKVGRDAGKFLVEKGARLKRHRLLYVMLFSFFMGVVITLAEPDVRVLAENVFDVSEGRVSEFLLMSVVGIGVGVLIVAAILRILKQWNLKKLLLGGYIIVFTVAILISVFTDAKFVPVAFDSGGVTTGPLTVPFFLAFAGGVTSIVSGDDKLGDTSFGIVGIASIGPIIAVLLLGGVFR